MLPVGGEGNLFGTRGSSDLELVTVPPEVLTCLQEMLEVRPTDRATPLRIRVVDELLDLACPPIITRWRNGTRIIALNLAPHHYKVVAPEQLREHSFVEKPRASPSKKKNSQAMLVDFQPVG